MYKDVFVFIEQRDNLLSKVGIELLGKARELADERKQYVVAVLVGEKVQNYCDTLIKHGADKVVVVEDPILKEYMTEPYTKAVYHIIETYKPEIMLFGATSIGRDLAPRLAARVHTGLTADCTKLEIDPETGLLMMTRPAFGGNLMATILCENHRPQMATVRPGVMESMAKDEKRTGEIFIEEMTFSQEDVNVEIEEVIKTESKKKDITEARILVSAGRGIGGPEGLKPLESFAQVIDAEVSSSRAVVDSDWIAKDRQVGQTGKTVRPEVYFAIGISGAVQHLAGMEESDLIIAVNKDEKAPIFDVADLGIVGDLNEIVPKLTELMEKELAIKEDIE
ncbi:MAG: electron transfer flavoprotein subunit alpha/FixB family protein [Eubacteriaceae bacterium]|jgi:electron transfer flavoprotein alpha subunit|nr:electron transfer flavoprotein subunit alpha/FixB family protein [Eubacteriaceae bacterium]